MNSNPSLAAFLPIKKEKKKTDSYVLVYNLFNSLITQESNRSIDSFYLISPRKELTELEVLITPYKSYFNFVLVPEEDLIGIQKPWIKGWRKQQLIKLASAEIVKEDHIITLDADVICIQPFRKEELIPNGKPLLQLSSKKDRPYWWEASAQLLQTEPFLEELGMSVTPAIFKKEVLANLLLELTKEDKPWINYLLHSYHPFPISLFIQKKRWTEYSLYHLYIRSQQKVEYFHTVVDESISKKLISEQSIWYKNELSSFQNTSSNRSMDDAYFIVIQSNMNLSASEIGRLIEQRFNIKDYSKR